MGCEVLKNTQEKKSCHETHEETVSIFLQENKQTISCKKFTDSHGRNNESLLPDDFYACVEDCKKTALKS